MGTWVSVDDDGKEKGRGHHHLKMEHMPTPKVPPRERFHGCYSCEPNFFGTRSEHPFKHDVLALKKLGDISEVVHSIE